jgi:hypothetical protein
MNILLGFLPFVAFAVLGGSVGVTVALVASAAVAAALVVRGRLAGASPKILEIGTLVLFVALALYTATAGGSPSLIGVKLCVDCGLLAIVLVSLAMGRPFTMQYAREQIPEKYWTSALFIRTNVVITSVWALAFAIISLAEAALVFVPAAPQPLGFVVMIAALVGAGYFTTWYPKRLRASA